jgi:hypothetical protein
MPTPKTFKLSKLQKFVLITALKGLRNLEQRAGLKPVRPQRDGDQLMVIASKKLSRPSGIRITSDRVLEIDIGGPKDPWEEDVSHVDCASVLELYFGFEFKRKGNHSDYKSATASLYRAIDRLEARGLITRRGRHNFGHRRVILQLTNEGITAAESLNTSTTA